MKTLPHEGRFHPSASPQFNETVLFIHHFGGNRSSTKRHQEFVGRFGFHSVSFNMGFNAEPSWKNPWREFGRLLEKSLEGSWQSAWTKDLVEVLDAISGDKIIYSFSSPSISVVRAVVEEKRADIKAWVCDGGPFLDCYSCLRNYYKYQTSLPAWAHPITTAIALPFFGAVGLKARVRRWMREFPKSIPILSIRGLKDRLVPPSSIEKFFAHADLNLQVFELPQADHLEGLKTFESLYAPVVSRFLIQNATSTPDAAARDEFRGDPV